MVARLLLGFVFFWAAIPKLAHPLRFVQAVRAYDATPEWLSRAIGYGLPVLELCLAVVLLVRRHGADRGVDRGGAVRGLPDRVDPGRGARHPD